MANAKVVSADLSSSTSVLKKRVRQVFALEELDVPRYGRLEVRRRDSAD